LSQVLDWSTKYRFFDLKKIKVFVLDEADVMIATQGHQVRTADHCWLFKLEFQRGAPNFGYCSLGPIYTNPQTTFT